MSPNRSEKRKLMKKFLFILGIVVIAGAVFVGGFSIGLTSDFTNTMHQVSMFEKELTQATMTFMHISYIDDGKIDDVKSLLNSELDSHIITLSQMLKDCPNTETQKHAQKCLARIATHRQKHPVTNSIQLPVPQSEIQKIDQHVNSILTNALNIQQQQN
jgi:hypothetical protein